MIDRKHAHDEVVRLKSIDKWLDSEDNRPIVKELEDALQAAATEIIATAVMNDWLLLNSKLPTPAQLRALVWAENDKHDAAKQERKAEAIDRAQVSSCATCRGFGFYGGIIGGRYDGPWKKCGCRAGDLPGVQDKIDEANKMRDKLKGSFPGARNMQAMIDAARTKLVKDVEVYNGDF